MRRPQDVIEGKMPLVVDTQAGVDFQFTSKDLTLNIKDLSQRVMKPAMVRLANYVDQKLMDLYASRSPLGSALQARPSTPSLISPLAFSAWTTRPSRRMTGAASFLLQTTGACWAHRLRSTSTRLPKGLTATVRWA